jgi:hypothetical protein
MWISWGLCWILLIHFALLIGAPSSGLSRRARLVLGSGQTLHGAAEAVRAIGKFQSIGRAQAMNWRAEMNAKGAPGTTRLSSRAPSWAGMQGSLAVGGRLDVAGSAAGTTYLINNLLQP